MMRELILFLILGLFFEKSLSQTTKLIVNDTKDYYEEYDVLTSDSKMKHGIYFKIEKLVMGRIASSAVGNFSQGKRSGYWEEYYPFRNNIETKGFYKEGLKDSVWQRFFEQENSRELRRVESNGELSLKVIDANPVLGSIGKYRNDRKVGLWSYYDRNGNHCQTFDYDKNVLIFQKGVDIDNTNSTLIGDKFFLYRNLHGIINYDKDFLKSITPDINNPVEKLVIEFTVNENGNTVNIRVLEDAIKSKRFEKRVTETIDAQDGVWSPKRVNGVAISSERQISFEIRSHFHNSFHNTEKGQFTVSGQGTNLFIKED
jgi:hypothetical protein